MEVLSQSVKVHPVLHTNSPLDVRGVDSVLMSLTRDLVAWSYTFYALFRVDGILASRRGRQEQVAISRITGGG